jgi:hypothetical protein
MSTGPESFWQEVKKSDEIRQAEDWLTRKSRSHPHDRRLHLLDRRTVEHSRRVAAASAILCFEAGLSPQIARAMASGALIHDSGKRHHIVFDGDRPHVSMPRHAVKFNINDPFTRYSQRRHPHDSWKDGLHVWPEAANVRNSTARFARLFALLHHTNFQAAERNYPSKQALDTYVGAGDVSANELAVVSKWAPILTLSDHVDVLTHPNDRPYVMEQVVAAGIDPDDRDALMKRAMTLAKAELVTPERVIPLHRAASALTEHQQLIDAYGIAA